MPRMHAIALGLAAATVPVLAHAEGESHGDPQRDARIERLIEQAIQGNSDADRQEQARVDRLVRQALERAGVAQGPAGPGQPGQLAQDGGGRRH
ncbi:hypothetical protein [Paracraurococcus lichenis]|uniref:DUF4148 domain-containing protein n=1 Tax=Paracraurococcus lichenis TaxID=3064888 RepID=A0ABT9ECH8_9PROT|nr:hypothetical protein [Paracraurococcus sp. LOR1-02]MDO9713919.1 hypothetical protein [Paracraurococcus sp. LOR1-02]